MQDKIKYLIALSQLKGVGFRRAHQIIEQYGSAYQFIETCLSNPLKIPVKIRENCNRSIINKAFEYAESQMLYCEKHKVRVLAYFDNEYPDRLRRYDDSPLVLYVQGNIDLNSIRMVGIVGTRNMTSYGKWMIEDVVRDLKQYEVVTISGLAYGVDTQVHRSSVQHNIPTVGVMGTGVDQVYPGTNSNLALKMTQCGGVISEYGIRTKAEAYHFPARNRIIAALSDALVVVESKERGGAMITADLAFGYGKDVFAFPGKASDNCSRGTNLLIKMQKAQLIENAEDLMKAMAWDLINPSKSVQATLFDDLSSEEQKILSEFGKNQAFHIDQVLSRLPFSSAETAALLLNLELKGMVRTLPGSRYVIV